MKQTIGVQHSQHGQIITCIYTMQEENGKYIPLNYNDPVMLENEEGDLFARVAWQRPFCNDIEEETSPKLRLATQEELNIGVENEKLVIDAKKFCKDCVNTRSLDMKIVDVAMLFDRTKLIFYFTAPTRIDFRELVKDLVREYRIRIELRQIGVRHETQMIGSLGNCGMICCCRRYLTSFAPVTIKMAKEQNLFLNPTKISGICGRLLCCLSFEQDAYEFFHKSCPKLGKRYLTDNGYMRVLRTNMFRNSVILLPESSGEIELTLDEWAQLNPRRPENVAQNSDEKQQLTPYKPEPYMNCSVDPQMIENDPDLHMFDEDFKLEDLEDNDIKENLKNNSSKNNSKNSSKNSFKKKKEERK